MYRGTSFPVCLLRTRSCIMGLNGSVREIIILCRVKRGTSHTMCTTYWLSSRLMRMGSSPLGDTPGKMGMECQGEMYSPGRDRDLKYMRYSRLPRGPPFSSVVISSQQSPRRRRGCRWFFLFRPSEVCLVPRPHRLKERARLCACGATTVRLIPLLKTESIPFYCV